jgi:hypothetical protein
MKPSKKGQFNRADLERVTRNALIFSAPALIVFLTQIQSGSTIAEASAAIQVWVLGVAIDALRKLNTGK